MSLDLNNHMDSPSVGMRSESIADNLKNPQGVISLLKRLALSTGGKTLSSETLTVTGAISQLTAGKVATAVRALIEVKGADVYFTTSGVAPTASNSFTGFVGDVIVLEGVDDLTNFKVISSGTSTLYVEYRS